MAKLLKREYEGMLNHTLWALLYILKDSLDNAETQEEYEHYLSLLYAIGLSRIEPYLTTLTFSDDINKILDQARSLYTERNIEVHCSCIWCNNKQEALS